jgi:hypothetical protein
MAVLAGVNDRIEDQISIGEDAEMRRSTGGDKKIERAGGLVLRWPGR